VKLSNFKRISDRIEPNSIKLIRVRHDEPSPKLPSPNFRIIWFFLALLKEIKSGTNQLNKIHHLHHMNASY